MNYTPYVEDFFKWHWAPSRGKSGGILVGVNQDSLEVFDSKQGNYFVIMLVYDNKVDPTWNLITVYGAAQPGRNFEFIVELSRIYQRNTLPCVIGGDFSIIRKSSEKNKPDTPGHWSFVFNAIIKHARLRELPQVTGIIPGVII